MKKTVEYDWDNLVERLDKCNATVAYDPIQERLLFPREKRFDDVTRKEWEVMCEQYEEPVGSEAPIFSTARYYKYDYMYPLVITHWIWILQNQRAWQYKKTFQKFGRFMKNKNVEVKQQGVTNENNF